MKIHVLTTGTVSVKRSFLFAASGVRRQLNLFLPDEFSAPLPIHAWAIEHEGRLVLVDTGETASARSIPFARFQVGPEQELPHALAAAGLAGAVPDLVVLTHMHGDHMDGAVHLHQPVLVHEDDLAYTRTPAARFFQRVLRQPVPADVDFRAVALEDGPFGGFAASRSLSADGRIVAVPTPGHTPGHISVVCVDDEGRHVLLAGDATDTLEQLLARRHDAVGPKPKVSVASIDRILAHAREHPTVYLPSHDPDSATRLAQGTTL
ncbi:MAG TPA: MBL fold metallo-hydrolase [Solirubrobacteraceae bacterium]|jgi:glyoxylase-like metal-dependent hydrolase (beta-lactamase superfamily II)